MWKIFACSSLEKKILDHLFTFTNAKVSNKSFGIFYQYFSPVSKGFEKYVSPYSKISVKSNYNLTIRPAGEKNANGILKCSFESGSSREDTILHNVTQLSDNNFIIELGIRDETWNNKESPISCFLDVPVQSNLGITGYADTNIRIQDINSGELCISTGVGSIETKDIRCDQLHLNTAGGNITSRGVLQGNIHLRSLMNGTIECQRLQGRTLKIETESGDIKVASCYCDESLFQSTNGNVTLNNLHTKCNVEITENGNLIISGLDGSVNATLNEGGAEFQVSALTADSEIFIKKGGLKLGLIDLSMCHLDLSATNIIVPSLFCNNKIASVKKGDIMTQVFFNNVESVNHILKVTCLCGSILLSKADWISTLNLKK